MSVAVFPFDVEFKHKDKRGCRHMTFYMRTAPGGWGEREMKKMAMAYADKEWGPGWLVGMFTLGLTEYYELKRIKREVR